MPHLPARTGTHLLLCAGQTLKITQSQGPQVIDTWAFSLPSTSSSSSSSSTSSTTTTPPKLTYLSPAHTRSTLSKLSLRPGDVLYSNSRAPMLTLLEDTTTSGGGVHDLLFAACDEDRYRQLGWRGAHASCAENLRAELGKVEDGGGGGGGGGVEELRGLVRAVAVGWTPDPVNLFMNVPVGELGGGDGNEGRMRIEGPRSQRGDFVVLRAEVDCVVVLSACPMDLNVVNGGVCRGVDIEVGGVVEE